MLYQHRSCVEQSRCSRPQVFGITLLSIPPIVVCSCCSDISLFCWISVEKGCPFPESVHSWALCFGERTSNDSYFCLRFDFFTVFQLETLRNFLGTARGWFDRSVFTAARAPTSPPTPEIPGVLITNTNASL